MRMGLSGFLQIYDKEKISDTNLRSTTRDGKFYERIFYLTLFINVPRK